MYKYDFVFLFRSFQLSITTVIMSKTCITNYLLLLIYNFNSIQFYSWFPENDSNILLRIQNAYTSLAGI